MNPKEVINPAEYGIIIKDKTKLLNLTKEDDTIEESTKEKADKQTQSSADDIIIRNKEFSIPDTVNKNISEPTAKSKYTKKQKNKSAKSETAEEPAKKKIQTGSDSSSNNNATKNQESKRTNNKYYIQVMYPNGTYINITAKDNTDFQGTKDLYHKTKEEYSNKASEIKLIGTTEGMEPNILYTKKFTIESPLNVIIQTVEGIMEYESQLKYQLEYIDEKLEDLNKEKNEIEETIKLSSYDLTSMTNGIPNEIIKLKYILGQVDETKQLANTFDSLKTCVSNLEQELNNIQKQLKHTVNSEVTEGYPTQDETSKPN